LKQKTSVVGLVVLVAVQVLAACAPPPPATVEVGINVSVEEAFEMRAQGAMMLDVRTLVEWDEAHIPNATLITLDQLEGRVGEVPTDIPVVIYCRSGNRSRTALAILQEAGYSNLYNMLGGINAWINAGLPTD
jgi:rhodanese-related sulfurtransferase